MLCMGSVFSVFGYQQAYVLSFLHDVDDDDDDDEKKIRRAWNRSSLIKRRNSFTLPQHDVVASVLFITNPQYQCATVTVTVSVIFCRRAVYITINTSSTQTAKVKIYRCRILFMLHSATSAYLLIGNCAYWLAVLFLRAQNCNAAAASPQRCLILRQRVQYCNRMIA